jgi:putative flippase GtrA
MFLSPSFLLQARRYVAVGLGSAATDLCVYALLTRNMGVDPLVANLISRPRGGVCSFVFNKLYTFKRTQVAGTPRELIRFWIIWMLAYAASEGLVWVFHSRLHWGSFITKVCAEAIVCSFVFLTHRYWTFRAR